MSRLFLAYWPSPAKAAEIRPWVQQAHSLYGGRMMRPDTLHMTLAFLGRAAPAQVQALVSDCAGWRLPAGSLLLNEPGRFPRAKVVWLGPSSPGSSALAWLHDAHERLWSYLAPWGWQPREAVFRPHVSLLRKAGPGDLAALRGRPVEWTPGRCVLAGSLPTAARSRYILLADVPLEAVADADT